MPDTPKQEQAKQPAAKPLVAAASRPLVPDKAPEIVLDWAAADKHLTDVARDLIANFAGKDNVNPFVYVADAITPLRKRYDCGERTAELHGAIFTLRSDRCPRV